MLKDVTCLKLHYVQLQLGAKPLLDNGSNDNPPIIFKKIISIYIGINFSNFVL